MRDESERAELLEAVTSAVRAKDGSPPKIVTTRHEDDTRPAVMSALAEEAAVVVGIGGDGTLRAIAELLRDSSVPLGAIPGGTGNLFASQLGVPLEFGDAITALTDGTVKHVDLGEVTYHAVEDDPVTSIFTIGCGVGFDAEIMASTPDEWKQRLGSLAYLAKAAELGLFVESWPCTVTIDNRVIETDASIAMVTNMGQLIPGLLGPVLPIDPTDSLFDLIVAASPNPFAGGTNMLDQLFRKELGGESGDGSIRLRGQDFVVKPKDPQPMQVDGDYVGDGWFSARVLPSALKVIVPKTNHQPSLRG